MKETDQKEQTNIRVDINGLPPSKEEVAKNFLHEEGCSQVNPLSQITIREVEKNTDNVFHLNPDYLRKTRKYLACGECGVQERFF